MKNLVILGAGTAGTTTANQLRKKLPSSWNVIVVDPEQDHVYQPGLLFLPFGLYDEQQLLRSRKKTLRRGVDWVEGEVEAIDPDIGAVALKDGGRIPYDLLVVASGTQIRPDENPGMLGDEWHKTVHDFYTLEGAVALRQALAGFSRGRLVLNVAEMPIKCPVAPLEFLFLADDYFRRQGVRDQVELVYATPLDGAFTKPIASERLSYLLREKGIEVIPEFSLAEVDADSRSIVSYDDRNIDYDLLVAIPTHMGAPVIEESGLGDELGFIPTNRYTLQVEDQDRMFALGDATDLPTSKAGSVAHFESGVLVENIQRHIKGLSPVADFDGHANCFIETGRGKGLLIDFNYEVEPLPGTYPLPAVGPFRLLGESWLNHLGKLGFRWLYWNMLLPGRPLPVPEKMSMVGKRALAPATT